MRPSFPSGSSRCSPKLFGVVAALLLTLGRYGLLADTVTRRFHEFGLRIAIGATNRDVIGMVLASAFRLVVAGIVIGVPVALWTKGYAAGVRGAIAAREAEVPVMLPVDTTAPIAVAVVAMLTVAAVASYVPARRAMKVDPIAALRTE
jgi:ABC-type antimicrobial peptide transport system permease subunit